MTKNSLVDEIGQFTTMPEAVIEMIPYIGSDAALVYLYLRYRTNKYRKTAWPPYKRMCADLGWGRRRIHNAIVALEDAKLIDRRKRFGQSTEYRTLKPPPVGGEDAETPSISTMELMEDSISTVEPQNFHSATKIVAERDLNQIEFNQIEFNQTESIKDSEELKLEARPNGRGPAVELLKRINHRYPPKKLFGTVDRVVGEDFIDLLRWGRIIRKWIARGYNPTNYHGMLEVFHIGWREDRSVTDLPDEERRKKYLRGWFDA